MDYILQKKYINSDFTTAELRKAKSIVIGEIDNQIIIIKGKEKKILDISIINILDITTIMQEQFKKIDTLVQLVYIDARQKLKIIRLNVKDNQIEAFINHIRKFKQHKDFKPKIKTCFKCGINYDESVIWCTRCGRKLNFACTKCSNENSKDSLICNDCLLKQIECEK